MADVYADHPFPLTASPAYEGKKLSKAFEPDMFERVAGEMAFGVQKMGQLETGFSEDGKKNMEEMGLVAGLPWCFSNHDIAFEEGNWSKWPPAPGVVKFICRSVDFWLHRDWWKFAACDRHGRQRPLRFVPRPKPAG
ncbi:hypothetical protein VDGE_30738 [Verticillium dahliae]|uniref:Uncharacterized protein n=1 Tax=Verticillium dahliae TaxID=27337 RepID=A0A444RIY4_VERDA|nr:hypothetical protein VDGE_30738 [Verticillium dahliae]